MKFLDEAVIYCSSGAGGDGCVSFRREKFIPKGGPDGGNGGRGASLIFEGTRDLNTLIDFRYTQHFKAKRGRNGSGQQRAGAGSDDLIIKVPVGTEIICEETGDVLIDITTHGEQYLMLKGGKGGRGNLTFVSSINRAPRQFTKGHVKQEKNVRLRLKLLADVGLLGLPNAGKSTFISSVSNAKPKIADYPFTTMHPQLGMVRHHKTDMVMADLPGLIRGASQGHGLGHRFLKHVSRCAIVLHLVDINNEDPIGDYQTIRNELAQHDEMYGMGLSGLPEAVALSKCDALSEDEFKKLQKSFEKETGNKVIILSAISNLGVTEVLDALKSRVDQFRLDHQEELSTSDCLSDDFPPEELQLEEPHLDDSQAEEILTV